MYSTRSQFSYIQFVLHETKLCPRIQRADGLHLAVAAAHGQLEHEVHQHPARGGVGVVHPELLQWPEEELSRNLQKGELM